MHTSLYHSENPPPSFTYEEASTTEIPRLAELATRLHTAMRELQPMPADAMDGMNDAHTAAVEALAVQPVTKSSEVADKLRVLACLIEGDQGGVLVLETILLEAVMHDLGALRIREAIFHQFGWFETIYGDLLKLRRAEYELIETAA